MAWWYARLLFQGDRLIDAGVHDVMPPAVRPDDAAPPVPPADDDTFTSVCVSGYALYGRLRGYYAVGVGRFRLDPASGQAFASEAGLRHVEPAGSLSAAQRAAVRVWLEDLSAEAWATSLDRFKHALGGGPGRDPSPAAVPPAQVARA